MSLRLVKGLVIGMGLILVIGFAVLVGGMVHQLTLAGGDTAAFEAALDLPPGARIESIAPAGRRLAVLVVNADGSREIRFLDPETGRLIGTVVAE